MNCGTLFNGARRNSLRIAGLNLVAPPSAGHFFPKVASLGFSNLEMFTVNFIIH